MTHSPIRPVCLLLVSALLASCGSPQPSPAPPGGTDTRPEGNYTDRWTLQEAMQIPVQKSAQTSTPAITDWPTVNFPQPNPRGLKKTLPGYHIWDTWPIRTLGGGVADIQLNDGKSYNVLIHLSVKEDVLPGKRHDIAALRYSYATDGKSWKLGAGDGLLFPKQDSFGSRNWAGSAVIADDGQVFVFYTATGEKGENFDAPLLPSRAGRGDIPSSALRGGLLPLSGSGAGDIQPGISYEQKIAVAWGPKLKVVGGQVIFDGAWRHKVILRADGTYYQTIQQSDVGDLYAFRDPWVFRDPADQKLYMLFEGNVGGIKSQQRCAPEDIGDAAYRASVQVPETARNWNGAIGLAVSAGNSAATGADLTASLTNWKLTPPLLTARCVNQELERPHFVFKDSKYYLFTSSHVKKFAEVGDLRERGAEGLYGFVGSGIRGNYTPLNAGGLVLNNPSTQDYQAYSYEVLPTPDPSRYLITSFIDSPGIGDRDIGEFASLPPEQQFRAFGGTLDKTHVLEITGSGTRLNGQLDYGQIKP